MKKKYILIFGTFFIVLLISSYLILNPKKNMENLKTEVIEMNNKIESENLTMGEIYDLKDNIETKYNLNFRNNLANPRVKILNKSGFEVISFDHNGTIAGINLVIDQNITASSGTGLFQFLGSQALKITTGWFTNLFADNINSTLINSTNINKGGSVVNSTTELDTLYLGITDQRFNETTKINSVNTTANIQGLGFWNTTQSYNTTQVNSMISGNVSTYYPISINLTANTYNGSLTNGTKTGYNAGHYICSAQFTNSHLCDASEVSQWFANAQSPNLDADAWIINYAPKYIPATVPVDDCGGFTYSGTATHLGNYMHFNSTTGGDFRAINCATQLKLACCVY